MDQSVTRDVIMLCSQGWYQTNRRLYIYKLCLFKYCQEGTDWLSVPVSRVAGLQDFPASPILVLGLREHLNYILE